MWVLGDHSVEWGSTVRVSMVWGSRDWGFEFPATESRVGNHWFDWVSKSGGLRSEGLQSGSRVSSHGFGVGDADPCPKEAVYVQ